ncbi:MAG: hypothetical protein ACPIOQ_34010, partial [Promethearchaeia archaeon]
MCLPAQYREVPNTAQAPAAVPNPPFNTMGSAGDASKNMTGGNNMPAGMTYGQPNMMPVPVMYSQPKKEETTLTPVYVFLGLIAILGIVAVVLTASNYGALVDMKAPPAATHDHALEVKIDSVKAEMGK